MCAVRASWLLLLACCPTTHFADWAPGAASESFGHAFAPTSPVPSHSAQGGYFCFWWDHDSLCWPPSCYRRGATARHHPGWLAAGRAVEASWAALPRSYGSAAARFEEEELGDEEAELWCEGSTDGEEGEEEGSEEGGEEGSEGSYSADCVSDDGSYFSDGSSD